MTRLLLLLFPLSLLISSCHHEEEKLNGALEALQLNAQKVAYPDKGKGATKYFTEIEKFQNRQEVQIRDEFPEPWQALGPHNIAGRALALALNPQNNKTLYCGSASGGLWRSYNQGKGISWQQVPLGFPVLGVSSISFAPNDSMTIYIGTGEVYNGELSGHGAAYRATRGTYGMGILKSSDGGVTWEKSLDWSYESLTGIHVVKVAPSDANVVYAGTTEGIMKSTDAGATWVEVSDVKLCTDLVIHPTDANDVIAGCGNFGSSRKGLYSTKDGGENWDHFEPNDFQGKIQLTQYDQNPEIVYASIGNGFGFNDGATWIYKTVSRANSWTLEGNTDYSKWQGWFAHDIAVNPLDPNELTMIGIEIWQSKDGGKTAEQVTVGGVAFGTPEIGLPDGPPNFTHSDHHDIIHQPNNENIIYVANDGGVYGSFDGGISWESLNGGMQTTQFYNGFSVFPSDTEVLAMGGLQDNSTIEYTGSLAWNRVIGGDGSWSALDPNSSDIRYGSLQNLNVYKATNGSNYSQLFIPGSSTPTSFIAPYVVAQGSPNTIYAGRSNLYRSDDGGGSWQTFGGLNGDFIFSMDVSPQNEEVVYLATAPASDRPRIFRTQNGGNTFQDITGDLPDLYINDIHVNPNNPDKLYITCGGFGSAQVFRSDDAGENWIDITSNLPKIPSSAIVVDPSNDSLIYMGNDYGVFYTEDEGMSWSDFNEGIIDAALVADLKINPITRKLYVATHGSGAFERDMIGEAPPSNTVNVDFSELKMLGNPVQEKLQISGMESLPNELDISVITADGKTLYSKAYNNFSGRDFILDVENWTNGQYFIRISNGSNRKSISFQILR